MALTMTRTRNQTTLVKLATRVANVHGELAFIEARLAAGTGEREAATGEALERRRGGLLVSRDALYVTLRQFDPELDPTGIGMLDDWLKPFGRGKAGQKRYEAALAAEGTTLPSLPDTLVKMPDVGSDEDLGRSSG